MCEVLDSKRKPITKKDRVHGDIPYYGATGQVDSVADYIFDEKLVLLGEDGAKWEAGANSAFIVDGKTWVNNHAHVLRPIGVLHEYLVYCLNTADLMPYITGVTVPKLNQQRMCEIEIPLPPLAVQREIVARLERELGAVDKLAKKFDELEAAAEAEFKAELKETFEEIKHGGKMHRRSSASEGRFGEAEPEGRASVCETQRLGDVCETISTRGHQIKQSEILESGRYPVVSQSENAIEGYTDAAIAITDLPLVLFGDHTCVVKLVDRPFVVGADGVKLLRVAHADHEYLFYWLQHVSMHLLDGEYRRHYSDLCEMMLPLPTHTIQREVVSRLDAAKAKKEKLVAAARKGRETAALMRKAILKEAFE